MSSARHRNYHIGRSFQCVNTGNDEYDPHHLMRAAYVRSKQRVRLHEYSRSMKKVGYYCEKCGQMWTIPQVKKILKEKGVKYWRGRELDQIIS